MQTLCVQAELRAFTAGAVRTGRLCTCLGRPSFHPMP